MGKSRILRLRVRIPSRYPDFVHQIHTIRLIQLRCRYKCCTKFNPTLFWPSGLDMSTSSFPLRANPNIASSTWFSTAIIPPVRCFIPKYHGLWVWGGWTKAVLQKKTSQQSTLEWPWIHYRIENVPEHLEAHSQIARHRLELNLEKKTGLRIPTRLESNGDNSSCKQLS